MALSQCEGMRARDHLPGLFEFYELHRAFLPLFFSHREYFYDWCEIGSIYGAPADCLWGGGRVGFGEDRPADVAALMRDAGLVDVLVKKDLAGLDRVVIGRKE